MTVRILTGHVLDKLAELSDESCHMVLTSPPYYGLRAYGTEPQVWGGDDACEHEWVTERRYVEGGGGTSSKQAFSKPGPENAARLKEARWKQDDTCLRCGAWRGELGQEPTVALYVEHLVAVFGAVRRVLRRDGVLFVNLGDSYATNPSNGRGDERAGLGNGGGRPHRSGRDKTKAGAKPKDLMLVPDRFRLAMQADGWYVRSKMPWVKRNCMPESVTDRPVTAVEDVMLFTRSPRYFWDAEAVRRGAEIRNYGPDKINRKRNVGGRTDGYTTTEGGYGLGHTGTRNFRTSDLFFDSLGLILDEDGEDASAAEPQPQQRKSDKQGDSGLSRYVGFNDRWRESGAERADAGPPLPPQGLILDEDGDPLALDVNPAGFKDAHFATFPPKLVRPLILAGTSEKGCCKACGAPWQRVTTTGQLDLSRPQTRRAVEIANEKGLTPDHIDAIRAVGVTDTGKTRESMSGWGKNRDDVQRLADEAKAALGGYFREFLLTQKVTSYWGPSCTCQAGDPVPCRVLDCFAGSGTTLLESDRLGRDAIGIDLNPDYITMAADRVTNDGPLFASLEVQS